MQLIIQSPGFVASNKLHDLIAEKAAHLYKIYDRITKCEVVLRKENDEHQHGCLAEAQLSVSRKVLFASYKAESFEMALQKVTGSLVHQLERYKDVYN
jgi:ribosomal subunit interface protein